jgi:hypothetical protein
VIENENTVFTGGNPQSLHRGLEENDYMTVCWELICEIFNRFFTLKIDGNGKMPAARWAQRVGRSAAGVCEMRNGWVRNREHFAA